MSQPEVDLKQRAKNRRTISALVILFAAPVILAYVAYHMGWFTIASKNKGQILPSPYPHFEQFQWKGVDHQPLHFRDFETQWWWIYFPKTNECDAHCEINMRLLTQTHAGLGKEAEKITRLVVFPTQIQYLDKADDKVHQIRLAVGDPAPLESDGIYLMDTHGNIFMRYDSVDSEEEAKLRSRDLRSDARRAMKLTGL